MFSMKFAAVFALIALSQAATNMAPQAVSLFRHYGLEAHPAGAASSGARCQEKVQQHVLTLCAAECSDPEVAIEACASPISDAELITRCCPQKNIQSAVQAPKDQRRRCGRALLKYSMVVCPEGCEQKVPENFVQEVCTVGITQEDFILACCPSNLF